MKTKLTVEEHIDSLYKSSAKKKKPNEAREEKLIFHKIGENKEVVMIQSDLTTEFNFPDRNPSLLDLFLYHFDDNFLDELISTNTDINNKLPPIFSNVKEKTRRRDLDLERRRLVLQYFATRLFIMSNPTKALKDNWPMKAEDKLLFLGRDNFRLMLSNMLIRLSLVKEVNQRLGQYILSGRYVNIDEKHKGTNRNQHLARFVQAKDPHWGHWITEVTTPAPKTDMPLLLKLLPLSSTEPRNVTVEPYNNLNLIDIHKEIIPCIRKGSVIVEDAYYLDDNTRKHLRESSFKYISAINPIRFAEVWTEAQKSVQKKGDWVVLSNKKSNEADEFAMMKWDPLGERKQYVLTNAFKMREKVSKKSVDVNTISETYRHLFNGCDRFNNLLNNKYWPYDRDGWQSNYDDFFFSSIILNIYVMYHEANDLVEKMSFSSFSLNLANTISKYAADL